MTDNDTQSRTSVTIKVVEPYSFERSLAALRSFQPAGNTAENMLRTAVRIDGRAMTLEVSPANTGTGRLAVSAASGSDPERVRSTVEWMLFNALDLKPFYKLAGPNRTLSAIVQVLYGLKPFRPASLFEMAVIAITEQQLSLASAYHIRDRLIRRFGEQVEELWVFPEPEALAEATMDDLRSCGLSRQKAGYIHDLAAGVAGATLDLDALKTMDDEQVRSTVMGWRGFGRWSADYMLIRGLARPDCVPLDDLGIRDVVGKYLGEGRRVSAAEAEKLLDGYRPYRGLLAFYLLVYYRLNKG